MINKIILAAITSLSLLATANAAENQVVSSIDRDDLYLIQDHFSALLNGENPSTEAWAQVGITLTEDESSIRLAADKKKLFGTGTVVYNKLLSFGEQSEGNTNEEANTSLSANVPIMLQSPHKFYDKHTGKIGRNLYKLGHYKVYMENTVQRYRTDNADRAHQTYTLFSAFADAFIQHYEEAKVIQIHGFSSRRRNTQAGKSADIIVSNGTRHPTPYLQELQICHRDNLGLVSRIYGADVFELGATTNKIGRKLNSNDLGHFIHIELSHEIRENHSNDEWIRSFAECI